MNDRATPLARHLTATDFFASLPRELIEFLAAHAERRRLQAGDLLFRHSERAERFHLIESGHIGVEVVAITGPPLALQPASESEPGSDGEV